MTWTSTAPTLAADSFATWTMAAQLASLAAEATPEGDVPERLRAELLRMAQVKAVALKRNDQRLLVLRPEMPLAIDQV